MVNISLTRHDGAHFLFELPAVERVHNLEDGFTLHDTHKGRVIVAHYTTFTGISSAQDMADVLKRAGCALYAIPMRQYDANARCVQHKSYDFIALSAIDYIDTMLPAAQKPHDDYDDEVSAYIGLRISLGVGGWADTLLTRQEAQDLLVACRQQVALMPFAHYQAETGHRHEMQIFSAPGSLYLNPANVSSMTGSTQDACTLVFHGNTNHPLDLTINQGSSRQFMNAMMRATTGLAAPGGITPYTALRLDRFIASLPIDGLDNSKFLLRLEQKTTPANPYARYLQLAFDSAAARQSMHDAVTALNAAKGGGKPSPQPPSSAP